MGYIAHPCKGAICVEDVGRALLPVFDRDGQECPSYGKGCISRLFAPLQGWIHRLTRPSAVWCASGQGETVWRALPSPHTYPPRRSNSRFIEPVRIELGCFNRDLDLDAGSRLELGLGKKYGSIKLISRDCFGLGRNLAR
jgi:hypothetical protein